MSTATQVIRIKPSLVPFTWKGAIVLVAGLVTFAGVLVSPSFFPLVSPFGPILLLIGLALAGLGFLLTAIGVVRRNMYTYQLTDSQIVIKKQLLGRSIRSIPFASISDVQVSQSLVGRLAGYGDIVPVTKSGYGLVRGMERTENIVAEMTNVPHPDKVANIIMSRISLVAKVSIKA
jgi:uncharacterized membrane protein YdbT with pleckstrin-like domain